MKRAIPALLLLATAAGAAGGLYYSWVIDPVEYVDTPPDTLRTTDRLVYLALVGDLYAHEGDLDLARERLAQLGVATDGATLAAEIESYLDAGGRPEDVRGLARLAETLGASGGVLMVFASGPAANPAGTPPAARVTAARPDATATVDPTATPRSTFLLIEQTALCAQPGAPGQIGVWVQDASGEPMAGVQVVVNWGSGQDRFFTGLHPDKGLGYGDFDMAPRAEYEVSLASLHSDTAHGLASSVPPGLCRQGVQAVDWRLTFQQGE